MRPILVLVLFCAVAATLTAQQLPWDGPLLPIDNSHVILRAQCAKTRQLAWSPSLQKVAHGLEPGEHVWMIMPDAVIAMTLGEQTCVIGEECGGAWASLSLAAKATRNAIAVVPKRFLTGSEPITAPENTWTRKGPCDEPPKMRSTELECTTWDLGFRGYRLDVQTESRLIQDTGWEEIRTHVRVFTHGGNTGPDPKPWQLISEGVDPLTPRAVLLAADSCRILWRKDEGIGAPALITVQMSRVTADGNHTWGREYTAGGQPCD